MAYRASSVCSQLRAGCSIRSFATQAATKTEGAANELWMRALEPKPPAYPRMSDSDKAKNSAIANVYTKLMWKREVVLKKDLNRKMLLKWAAIHALPTDELRREALRVDPSMPNLKIPRWTPPLAGFAGPEEMARAEAAKKVAADAGAQAAAAAAAPAPGKPGLPARGGAGRAKRGPPLDMASMLGLSKLVDQAGPSKGASQGPETGPVGARKR